MSKCVCLYVCASVRMFVYVRVYSAFVCVLQLQDECVCRLSMCVNVCVPSVYLFVECVCVSVYVFDCVFCMCSRCVCFLTVYSSYCVCQLRTSLCHCLLHTFANIFLDCFWRSHFPIRSIRILWQCLHRI